MPKKSNEFLKCILTSYYPYGHVTLGYTCTDIDI